MTVTHSQSHSLTVSVTVLVSRVIRGALDSQDQTGSGGVSAQAKM